ncbi:MAG: tetratricopeptide repeat protein [Chloroflexota bacterium]|nr:tetratricopeptide repeat protein [Chloroflexota bacterium]
MTVKLELELLGGLRITQDGTAVTNFVSGKAPALLCYLAVTGQPQFRAALAGLLWSEQGEDDARRNLRVVLNNLRHVVAPHLVITRDTIAFDRSSPYRLDVEQFEAAFQGAASRDVGQLQVAVTLYRGDFLEGFYVRDAPLFEEWVTAQRERLRQLAMHALHELVSYHTTQQAYAVGIDYCTRLLQLDPWSEDAHRQLMLLLALSGQRSAALAQYDACCRVLEVELGGEPSEETTQLYVDIRDGVVRSLQHTPVRVEAAPVRTHIRRKLPTQPTCFIGREVELAQITQRLTDPMCRLLTLVGPGGIGKTRLALQAAADSAAIFPDGAAFVPLASATTVDQMTGLIADALGVALVEQRDPRTELLAYLRDKRLLLLLDNLEHLDDGIGLICAILESAPDLMMLATSRKRLSLQAEWLLDVQGLPYPLSTPSSSDLLELTHLETYGAVQLFLQRAIQVQPNFTLSATTISPVIRICQYMQGMPLGIELAAAWVRTVPCGDLAEEIAHSLDFLSTTLWDVPARHRSLRAVFDHSWRLLSPEERMVLAQLAVFRGGFQSEAAIKVAEATLPVLAALVDTSLLQQEVSGRYALHELLRQFAAEHLSADFPDLAQAAPAQHSRYYLYFLAERQAALHGRESQQVMAELRAELNNIRQAWQWAVTHAQIDALDRASHGLADVYDLIGLFQEGVTAFETAVERVRGLLAAAPPDRTTQSALGRLLTEYARFLMRQAQFDWAVAVAGEAAELARTMQVVDLEAMACHWWGEVLWRQADYPAARMQLERALTLARTAGLSTVEIDSLLSLGKAALWQGDYAVVRASQEQALQRSRATGHRRGEGTALNNLGLLALWQGDFATAQTCQEQALWCYRAAGHQSGEAFALTCLGHVALGLRKYAQARTSYDQALQVSQAIGDRFGESLALACLGYVPFYQGAYQGARAHYEQALQLHHEIGDRRGESDMLANLGLVFHLLGDNATARDYSQQALRIAQDLGNQPFQARALTFLGHALVGLDRLEEAAGAYQQAVDLRRALNQAFLAMEPHAGLARVALAEGDLEQAQQYVVELLAYLPTSTLDGLFEPLRVYLTCYKVLRATSDPRAEAVLHTAHDLLQAWAENINDPELRHSFLDNVAAHREIVSEYTQLLNEVEVPAQHGF